MNQDTSTKNNIFFTPKTPNPYSEQDIGIGIFFNPISLKNDTTQIIPAHSVTAIVPTFKPSALTVGLIKEILSFNPEEGFQVVVVDDCTPHEYEEEHHFFQEMKSLDRVTYLRTPQNKMKAGAINYALAHISSLGKTGSADIVITLDDDVVVEENTMRNLVQSLLSDDRLGATCSQCRALNKDKNILTRLQGLEYLGFSAVRLSDEGFFNGPLVMHGMLTAFRMKALNEVGVFAEGHLIEDYEMTARLKLGGWQVRLAPKSMAWTEVPETFKGLWRQRVRWIYGGLTISRNKRYWRAIIQDLIGHIIFISTFFLIILSFLIKGGFETPEFLIGAILYLSLLQVSVWYVFQIWFMRFYIERDRKDWVIRLTLIPEFVYANLMTLVLLGSYLFSISEWLYGQIPEKSVNRRKVGDFFRRCFQKIGYECSWGTRTG